MNNQGRIDLFDGFSLDPARGCVMRSGEPVHLRPQAYEVLKYLVENRNHLISKDKLIEEVWKGRAVTDGSLGKCVEEVRDKLGPEAKRFIRNVRGRGYIFDAGIEHLDNVVVRSEQLDVVRVTVHEEGADEKIELSTAPAAIPASWPRLRVRTTRIALAALLVIGTATAFGTYWFRSQRQPKEGALAVPFREMEISRLTTSGKTTHAAISPDGKYVAHVTDEAEGSSLWIKHVDAPSNVRIAGPAVTEYAWVSFAPAGDSVYYLALDRDKGESTLYRVPVLGGSASVVGVDMYPTSFSPDGKQMASFRIDRGDSHLIIAEANGTNRQVLATRRPPDFLRMEWNAPAWSPNGKVIACPIRLNDDRGHFETVVGVSVADRVERPLTSKRWSHVGQPVWLPDGSGLLVTASEGASAPMQVWHIKLDSGEATRVTNDLNDYHDLSLTKDASRLAIVQNQSLSSISVGPAGDAVSARQISTEVGSLEVIAWTPDGKVLYRSNAGGAGADIWVINADGSNRKQLTIGAGASRGLAVTPDGRHIVFVSDRAGHFNLWRVDMSGGNLRQLTGGAGEFYPHCTPDSQWVVYQSGEMYPTLWKVPVAGGEPVQLTKTRGARPAVSPDGEMIAYHYLDPDLEQSRWGIGIVAAKGGERLKRFDFPPTVTQRYVRWTPDSQAIAFLNSPGYLSDIWLQPLDGKPAKQLTNFKTERILAFDWSPDGRSLAVVSSVETSDVVLIKQEKR